MRLLVVLACWLVTSNSVMLPVGDDVAMLDGTDDAVEVSESKVSKVYQNGKWVAVPIHKVATRKVPPHHALRKDAMGTVDGSQGKWKPFVDKVPKRALNPKRTFLPKTAKAFRLNNMKKIFDKGKWKDSPEEKRIQESLKKAEDLNHETSVEKMMHQRELRESKDVSKAVESKPQWPLKATKQKAISAKARWPFGHPHIELLQDSESDSKEDEDEQKIERLDDPVQDMLTANGWTADMLNRDNQVHSDRDEDDERQGRRNDDDQQHTMLGENSQEHTIRHVDNNYQGELSDTHSQYDQDEEQDLGESMDIDQHQTARSAPKLKKAPSYKMVSMLEPKEDDDENEDIDIINGDPEGTDDP